MTPAEAAAILERHNRWRRDDYPDETPIEMESPRVLGEAIDVAVAYIRANPPKVRKGTA